MGGLRRGSTFLRARWTGHEPWVALFRTRRTAQAIRADTRELAAALGAGSCTCVGTGNACRAYRGLRVGKPRTLPDSPTGARAEGTRAFADDRVHDEGGAHQLEIQMGRGHG